MKRHILSVLVIQFFLFGSIPYLSYGAEVESVKTDATTKHNVGDVRKLTKGDMLQITVYKEPDLSGVFEVKENGTITYPLVGNIEVEGLTQAEANAKITVMLEQGYLTNPSVQVSMSAPTQEAGKMNISNRVTILGCVTNPGLYSMPIDKNLTTLQLVALAGGFTRYAAINNTKVMRINSEGQRNTMDPHLDSVVSGTSDDMVLESGDMVYVPDAQSGIVPISQDAGNGNVGGNVMVNIGNSVTILGCVTKSGLYNMPIDKNLTTLQLVALAGGFTRYAAINNTKVVRTNSEGQRNTMDPHLDSVVNGRSDDMVLEPGDMVYVPERMF